MHDYQIILVKGFRRAKNSHYYHRLCQMIDPYHKGDRTTILLDGELLEVQRDDLLYGELFIKDAQHNAVGTVTGEFIEYLLENSIRYDRLNIIQDENDYFTDKEMPVGTRIEKFRLYSDGIAFGRSSDGLWLQRRY